MHCVGISVEEANAIEKYFCKVCLDPQNSGEHRNRPGRKKSSCKQLKKSLSGKDDHKAIMDVSQLEPNPAFFPSQKPSFDTVEHNDAIDSQETLSSYKCMGLDSDGLVKINTNMIPEVQFGEDFIGRVMNSQPNLNIPFARDIGESFLQSYGNRIFKDEFNMNLQDDLRADFL